MAATVGSSSKLEPTSLRELLQRLPQVLEETPAALKLEGCGSPRATKSLTDAQTRFLTSARSFFQPCFQASVLDNLTRDDPVAPPTFENDYPDQTAGQSVGRRRMDSVSERIREDQRGLRASTARIEQQAMHLHERLAELARQAEVASEAGISVLDTRFSSVSSDESLEASDRHNAEVLREQVKALSAAETWRATLVAELATLRGSLARDEEEVSALEAEQAAAAVAAAAGDAKGKSDASKEMENMVGVTDMSEAQLDAAVHEEEVLVRRNSSISEWYTTTVANLEQITGVRISHRMLFGTTGGGGVEGLELMVDLGSGQIMEVTVSAADGGIRSAQLCFSQDSGKYGGGVTPSELAELQSTAQALPSPGNLRMLVREALSRARCAEVRGEHVRLMRKRYLVGYRAPTREVTITMPVGIVASFRLHPDYPKIAGGAEVMALTGVGGWSPSETEELCRRVNSLALATIMETMDRLEDEVAALDGGEVTI